MKTKNLKVEDHGNFVRVTDGNYNSIEVHEGGEVYTEGNATLNMLNKVHDYVATKKGWN